ALTGPTDQLTAYEQGACYGEQNVASCQTVPTVAGTAGIEKGTCEALKGTTCGSLPTGQPLACTTSKTVTAALDALLRSAEQQTCANTPSLDISAASDLLFCSQQEVPPAFKVVDDPVTAGVETALRLNDLSMAIVIDRDSSGDLPAGGELGSTPNCFGGGASAGDDCFLAAACLD